MQDFSNAFGLAASLIFSADADLIEIIALSLRVSVSAVVLAALIGFPLGALTAVAHFPGRQTLTVTLNALMGLPPVVVGLANTSPMASTRPGHDWIPRIMRRGYRPDRRLAGPGWTNQGSGGPPSSRVTPRPSASRFT